MSNTANTPLLCPYITEKAIWNPYVSGNLTGCQTPQMHHLCALSLRRIHAKSVRVGLPNRVPNTALHFLCTPAERRSHFESAQLMKLNGVPNNEIIAVVCTFLIEEPYGTRTSLETQLSAKHHKCTTCVHFLSGESL